MITKAGRAIGCLPAYSSELTTSVVLWVHATRSMRQELKHPQTTRAHFLAGLLSLACL